MGGGRGGRGPEDHVHLHVQKGRVVTVGTCVWGGEGGEGKGPEDYVHVGRVVTVGTSVGVWGGG